ncbi:class I SAM-dependent methyltransferase [Bacillus mesophilum]|uniref:Class I SAM-dependent methyltransferase n=1 Tax=Bacillus mesophilum TaxID=1071718 RepID=A0A7V7RLX4_9BACI|nr:class I SAM-dependent methyltransferase [Bacillus mesophilum]KAB2332888.1 class I SAM-dependent methyltransferase [Bacillus mesophilum]
MNRSWNAIIYKLWSPIYDHVFNKGMFLKARKEVFKNLKYKKGSKILLVGAGTGADIPFFLDKGYVLTAIDYSEEMLAVAKSKFKDKSITFKKMDAQKMEFEENTFDFIAASLVISVVPKPEDALSEITRVLKKNGEILIFDKFAPVTKKLNVAQKILRPIIKLLGTDIGIDFHALLKPFETQLELKKDDAVMLNGMYRKILLVKQLPGNQ